MGRENSSSRRGEASSRRRYQAITYRNVAELPQWERLDAGLREATEVVSRVLPFRTNRYITDELIDWDRVPDDPIFQLTFPQRGMLTERDYLRIRRLLREGADAAQIDAAANTIRRRLNPHPAGQKTHNVPVFRGHPLPGAQHKYPETVLFFPSHGQTCHAYCTFCFRWPQFVGMEDLRFASREVNALVEYLREHTEVTDVLITGGDPMIMNSRLLRRTIEPLLVRELAHVQSIRIGTKAVAYWPQRFVADDDADDLMGLLEDIRLSGRHVSIMGHYSHPVELSTEIAREAVARIRATGAILRMQSPIIRHVNDDPRAWVELWKTGVRLGCVPYYVFVERDTGARDYFALPLARVWEIYQQAYHRVSGLARTVRGPSMSAFRGKVHVLGITDVGDERAFVLQYLQARDATLVRRPFFAKFDAQAVWFDQLRPLSEADRRFFANAREHRGPPTIPLTVYGADAVA